MITTDLILPLAAFVLTVVLLIVSVALGLVRLRDWIAERRAAAHDVSEDPRLSSWQLRKQRAAERAVRVSPRRRRGRSNSDKTIAVVSAILDGEQK